MSYFKRNFPQFPIIEQNVNGLSKYYNTKIGKTAICDSDFLYFSIVREKIAEDVYAWFDNKGPSRTNKSEIDLGSADSPFTNRSDCDQILSDIKWYLNQRPIRFSSEIVNGKCVISWVSTFKW